MLNKCFICFMCLLLTACATQTGLREELDRSVKAYNRLLRWHELESAVMTYADSEQKEESIKQLGILKKRGISVTDYRILSTEYIPAKKTGDVITEFDYYILPSNKIKTISNRQEWTYLDNSKSWKLKSSLPAFE